MSKVHSISGEITFDYVSTIIQKEGETLEEMVIRHDNAKRIAIELAEKFFLQYLGQVSNVEATIEEVYDEEECELVYKRNEATLQVTSKGIA